MRVAVIDAQGGGIGRLIVERLRQEMGDKCYIIGLGTNAIASSLMLKAGANEGASGENAIVRNVGRVDIIVGSVAIMAAHAYLGELTPLMAEAIAASDARKILLPINRSGIEICGCMEEPLPLQVGRLIGRIVQIYEMTLALG